MCIRDSSGETTRLGVDPGLEKFLEVKANGDDDVLLVGDTLGLKSSVSDALKLSSNIGTSFENLS